MPPYDFVHGTGLAARHDGSRNDLHEYLAAARRKILVAAYHRDQLARLLPSPAVTVPIQAHLEGVLFAFIAATDQIAEFLRLGLQPPSRRRHMNLGQALEALRERGHLRPPLSALEQWWLHPLTKDAHRLRVDATHHHYRKRPIEENIVVEAANPAYTGSRELRAYSAALVSHLDKLSSVLDMLEDDLRPPPP